MNDPINILEEQLLKKIDELDEVYANSGLGKWFRQGKGGTGWDRYNSKGKKVGKCGDAKKGASYSACLGSNYAKRMGKKKIAAFVRRKKAAQRKAGRGEKGTGGTGKSPIRVSYNLKKE